MTTEILGLVSTQNGSESIGYDFGPIIDPEWTRELSRAHERAGFDRVLIGYSASSPDGFAVASTILGATDRLGVLIAHRPGFVAPTLEARKLATLDHLTGGGRVAIHHISGGSDADQRRDGDFSDKADRYRRTGEFIEVLRATLTSDEPFDYSGDFYRVEGGYSAVKPATAAGIPIYFGGQSGEAVTIGAKHADTFALFGEPLADTAERIGLIDEAARRFGRTVDYSLSTRPVVGATEQEAWQKAAQIADDIEKHAGTTNRLFGFAKGNAEESAVSAARLQTHATQQEVHDERLWFGATKRAGLGGNSSGHVGTAEQVADALIQYWDLGVRKFLIRGFDPLADVELWGTGLIPALRERIAEREARARQAA